MTLEDNEHLCDMSTFVSEITRVIGVYVPVRVPKIIWQPLTLNKPA